MIRSSMTKGAFNPQLTRARFLPRTTALPWNLRIIRALSALQAKLSDSKVEVAGVDESVSVRVWRTSSASPAPGLLWIHGGGMVIGTAAQDDRQCGRLARELGVVVASVEYRLAPEFPYPVPLEDCYKALLWLAAQPDVDGSRIAIGGASAGGGLAAGVALLDRERGEVGLVAQMLAYPMIDDRTAERADIDGRRLRMWNQRSNRFGWASYLGARFGGDVPAPAAPSRCSHLRGLPPAWIGVGTNDLFHDEDVAYATRLRESGVPCELHVVPGAYHGFDLVEARAPISREFTEAYTDFLKDRLSVGDPDRR